MTDTTTAAPVPAGFTAAVNAFDKDAMPPPVTRTFEAMLTRPFVIHYYDIAYFSEGIATRQTTQP